MSGNNHLKQLAHAYAAMNSKHLAFEFKGQAKIPHNPRNNKRTKSKGKSNERH